MRGFRDKTLLLEPGNWYDLHIVRILEIREGDRYYLARDSNGLKHLITEKHYAHYGIRPGVVWKCRLDRINCQGRFYFEPRHPLYIAGRCYQFELLNSETVKINGVNQIVAIVGDAQGKHHRSLPVEPPAAIPATSQPIWCRVERIKKSRLILTVLSK